MTSKMDIKSDSKVDSKNDSYSDTEDELFCPLCVEEIDLADKNFLPCPCGYRVMIVHFVGINIIVIILSCIGVYVVLASYKRKFKWFMSC